MKIPDSSSSAHERRAVAAFSPPDSDLGIAALDSEKTPGSETAGDRTGAEDGGNKEDNDSGGEEGHISFRPVERVDVSVRNLSITVSPHSVSLPWSKKTEEAEEIRILDDVSADFPAGELVAIIGGSGSGKVCLQKTRKINKI